MSDNTPEHLILQGTRDDGLKTSLYITTDKIQCFGEPAIFFEFGFHCHKCRRHWITGKTIPVLELSRVTGTEAGYKMGLLCRDMVMDLHGQWTGSPCKTGCERAITA